MSNSFFNKLVVLCLLPLMVQCAVRVLPPQKGGGGAAKPFSKPVEYVHTLQARWLKAPSYKIRMFLFGETPHQYRARFEFQEPLGPMELWVNGALVENLNGSSTSDVELFLKDDEVYNVLFKEASANLKQKPNTSPNQKAAILDPSKNLEDVIEAWEFKTPKDLELGAENSQSLFKSVEGDPLRIVVSRLFIAKGPQPIMTEGRNILMSADELIADQGEIATFLENQKAMPNHHGRRGGTITLKAKTAKGSLHFFFRGENGGDGMAGEPFAERAPKGKDLGLELMPPTFENKRYRHCMVNGLAGEKGQDGRKGHDGGQGGNSGSLVIEIAEPSPHFTVTVDNSAGRGGLAGAGGPGQRGGEGGMPFDKKICAQGEKGKDGQDGQSGVKGLDGIDGSVEEHCIRIGEGFGRC